MLNQTKINTMKTRYLILFVLFTSIATIAKAQSIEVGNTNNAKETAPNKEYFDTVMNRNDYKDFVKQMIDAGWEVTVEKDGEMRKISAWRYVPLKFVVASDGHYSLKEATLQDDGTRILKCRLAEPENGVAVFTLDKEGNILSFSVFVSDGK